MKRVAFAVPGDLTTPTGGYAYDRRMIAEFERLGWNVQVVNLGGGFPHPSAAQRDAAHAELMAVSRGCPIIIDGLAFGVLRDVAAQLSADRPLLALVHHPLALESGLSPKEADALHASERAALAHAKHVVVTSPATARLLAADYDVSPARITVARPGTDPAPTASGSADGVVRLLAVGAIVPRKGYDVLIAALSELKELPWHLTIAGDRSRDPQTARRLDIDILRHQLTGRVAVLGAVSDERLGGLYAGADLFALPSRYEGYGMVFSEALAHGLPVIGTNAGAIPETVPAEAGVLVPCDDVAALAGALRRVIESPEARRRMAAAARQAARRLPTWAESAHVFSRVIAAIA